MEILTVDQTAAFLKVRRETILRKIYSKELRACKVGRIWRIKKEDIETFLKKNENMQKERTLEDGIFFDDCECLNN